MAEKTDPTSEGGMAVLTAVRRLLEDNTALLEAQEAGDEQMATEVAFAAMGRAMQAMQRDWPPSAQYQTIAMLSAMIRVLSRETGKSEDEILADLESIYH